MATIVSTRFAGDQCVEYIASKLLVSRKRRECDCCGRDIYPTMPYLELIGNAGTGVERRRYCLDCDEGEYSGVHAEDYRSLQKFSRDTGGECFNCGSSMAAGSDCFAWANGIGQEVSPHYCSRDCGKQDMEHGTDAAA